MLRNKKGFVVATPMIVALGLMSVIGTVATVETAKNGVLKSNGKRIWCKMQNKGADYCDAMYAPIGTIR